MSLHCEESPKRLVTLSPTLKLHSWICPNRSGNSPFFLFRQASLSDNADYNRLINFRETSGVFKKALSRVWWRIILAMLMCKQNLTDSLTDSLAYSLLTRLLDRRSASLLPDAFYLAPLCLANQFCTLGRLSISEWYEYPHAAFHRLLTAMW